jgi:hypothetical protein
MIGLELSDREVASATDEVVREFLRDIRSAVDIETRGLEQDLEKITRLAMRGKLWRAWKSETFPRGGRIAREPSGEVYVNGGERSQGAMTFATTSGRITGRDGWLTIPTQRAMRRGRPMTVREWEAQHGQRLDMIFTKRGFALLVADGTPTMAAKTAGRMVRARRKPIVVFILVKQVDFHGRFSVETVAQRRQASLAGRLSR